MEFFPNGQIPVYPFNCQPTKWSNTQIIRQQQSTNCLSVFYNFVELKLEWLKSTIKTLEQRPRTLCLYLFCWLSKGISRQLNCIFFVDKYFGKLDKDSRITSKAERCFIKKAFLKFSQNSVQNTGAGVSF